MKSAQRQSRSAFAPIATLLVLASAPQPIKAQTRPEAAPGTVAVVARVKSRDGTTIAYEKSGEGPTLVLVASALSDRSDAARLAALLAPAFTVINFDRRGRGDSGDTKPYAVRREIEDIEALIDAAGGSAFLFGSSSGAVLALEAADKLSAKIKALALFEPPFIVDKSRPPIPDGFFNEIDTLVSKDRRGDAVALFMTKGIGVPDAFVAEMKRSPMWGAMEKRAHTLPYDGAVMAGLQAGKPLPKGRWTSMTARTLVIDGGESDAFLRSAAQALSEILPASKRRTLKGQDHSVVFTAPEALAPVLVEFFASGKAAVSGVK